MKNLILSLIVWSTALNINAQNTVGLTQYSPETVPGYVLFSPINTTSTYLIDRCGHLRHS
ncbi:MAG: hypothetical protein ACKO66_09410 [Flavobacteriales bacterium]